MPLREYIPLGYPQKSDLPNGYNKETSRPIDGYRRCGHLRLVDPPPPETPNEVLESAEAVALAESLACIPHMREERLLEGHPLVERLNSALRSTSDTAAAVEEELDTLFAELRTGEEFAHTELVMILLYSMKNVGVSTLAEILDVLNKSRSPELARLRRFAAMLLTNGL